MAKEGFLLGDCSSNQYLENYIQIKKEITTQDNHCKSKGKKRMCEHCETAALQKFTNNGPNEHLCHRSKFFFRRSTVGLLLPIHRLHIKKKDFTEKARYPHPLNKKRNVALTEPSLYTKCLKE